MANSFIEYTGDGTTQGFTVTFNYLAAADVKAFVNGSPTTAFSLSGQTLTFNTAPPNQAAILIERDTPKASRVVDFSDGAILSEADLDKNANQLFFISQEAIDTAERALTLDTSTSQYSATVSGSNRRLTNVADPVNGQDVVTKNWLTTTYLTPTSITDIGTVSGSIASVNNVSANITNVNSVNSNSANINTVAGNNTNINTVAGINSEITTVAGISTAVSTVANASTSIATVAADIQDVQTVASDLGEAISEIETVAADLQEAVPEIDTVAGAITNVNTVGTNINNVNTAATNINSVNTVAGQISPTNNINTVAGINTEISNVSGISTAVSAVGGSIANVNTVAGQISPTNNISTVASNISDVQDVANNVGAISTVNGISGNVTTVAGISADVTAAAGNATNITNVANNSTNINAVAGAITNVNTVAANTTNIGTVAGVSSDVTTVAGVSSDVSTVAGVSSSVTAVANNVTGVNSFADRYRVGSSNPSSSLDSGDLFFNTTDNALRYYDGSGWQNITGFTTGGTMTGDLTVTNDINFDGALITDDLRISSNGTTASFTLTHPCNMSIGKSGGDNTLTVMSGTAGGCGINLNSSSTSGFQRINAENTTYALEFQHGGTTKLEIDANGVDVLGNNIEIDANKGFNNSGAWTRNTTPYGNIEFGPANVGHAHIYTDRSNFWFNKQVNCSGNIVAYASDERLKENIETIPNALEKVCQLRGVTFDWKDGCEEKGFTPDMKHETGVIAQEVQKVIPDAVTGAPFDNFGVEGSDSGEQYLTVQKEKIIPVLIEAIKELKAEIEELKNASAE